MRNNALKSLLFLNRTLKLILVFILFSNSLYAQETNYWFHNYGSGSFLKGGIEVGGVRTTSAVYYNPGALSFLSGTFLEAQADVISLDYFFIENGAGDGIPINVLQLDASPSFFAYTQNFKNFLNLLTR